MRQPFTNEEMAILQANKNVLRCSSKRVQYTEEFKRESLKKHEQGTKPMQIFKEAGLDVELIGRKAPKWCIERWRNQLQTYGYFKDDRGKREAKPKERALKDERARTKYLEARIAYLEKENAFLAKLRAERAE